MMLETGPRSLILYGLSRMNCSRARPTDGTFVHTLGWVYDFKLKDGVVVDKARLVGHGNKSVLGTHFFDKTAQVARASSVRTICAYAAQYNLVLTAADAPCT